MATPRSTARLDRHLLLLAQGVALDLPVFLDRGLRREHPTRIAAVLRADAGAPDRITRRRRRLPPTGRLRAIAARAPPCHDVRHHESCPARRLLAVAAGRELRQVGAHRSGGHIGARPYDRLGLLDSGSERTVSARAVPRVTP